MTPYTVYNNTGKILRSGYCQPGFVDRQAQDGEFATPFASNDMTDYVFGGVITSRPYMTTEVPKTALADGVTPIVLHDVPSGATVTVTGPVQMIGITDQHTDVSLTFVIPGDYRVTVECFPYVTVMGVVNAA